MLVFRLDQVTARRPQDHHVDRDDGGNDGGVDQQALEDDLDVHQPVADDGRGKRERDERQRHGEQFHRQRRPDTESKRQHVADGKRQRPERRAPDDPSQLARGGDRTDATERANEDGKTRREEAGEVQQLERVEERDHAHEIGRVGARAHECKHPRRHENARGQVDRRQPARQHGAVAVRLRPLGKHESEVQEQRRDHRQRHRVGPVKKPVDAIEAAGEREREGAEKRDREPEEVQRRLIEGPPGPNRGAHEEREDPDRGEHVIEAACPVRKRRHRQLDDFAAAQAKQRVAMAIATRRRQLHCQDVGPPADRLTIDGQQHVTGSYAGVRRGRSSRDFRRNHPRTALDPKHAVFNVVRRGSLDDVRHPHREEKARGRQRQD